jgi:hypothetical protein
VPECRRFVQPGALLADRRHFELDRDETTAAEHQHGGDLEAQVPWRQIIDIHFLNSLLGLFSTVMLYGALMIED